MIDTALIDQVYVACFPCDMRKSINGLSALVQLTFDMDPFANHLYVFFNRKGDKAKILRWSNNGWWLYYRKLSRGTFKWVCNESQTVKGISERQLRWLLDGLSLEQPQAHRAVSKRLII